MSFSFRQSDYDVGFETRPRMLKDFLQENLNSCSSSGFHYSFPRKPIKLGFEKSELNYYSCTTNSLSKTHYPNVLYAVVAAVKNISRKLSGKRWKFDGRKNEVNSKVKVQVKDIIRWKSFRDLANDDYPPFDLTTTTTPDHCPIIMETTTTTSTSTTTNSNNSSWCESDFTAELPSWRGFSDGEGEIGNKYYVHVSRDSKEDDKKEETLSLSYCHEEEEERLSPVSVLDYPFEETMKRRRLLEQVKSSVVSFSESCKLSDHFLDKLLLDYFWEESESETEAKLLRNSEKMRKVEAWMNGEGEKGILEYRKEACVEEMDREGKWNVFGEDNEREELGLEIENEILGSLVDEILLDVGHVVGKYILFSSRSYQLRVPVFN